VAPVRTITPPFVVEVELESVPEVEVDSAFAEMTKRHAARRRRRAFTMAARDSIVKLCRCRGALHQRFLQSFASFIVRFATSDRVESDRTGLG
jgi:hypothetical protein